MRLRAPTGLTAAFAGFIALATPALADNPVAMVEAVTGAPPGVAIMDYLAAGKVIKLGATDGLVVDYFRSCLRETIRGGTVTIGADQSSVAGGAISSEKVDCDGGQLRLTREQASESGVVVYRVVPKTGSQHSDTMVERTLYGLSPVIEVPGGGRLVVERLDRTAKTLVIDASGAQLMAGDFYDFAKHGQRLAAGGIYRASANGNSVVFKIDPRARPGEAALAARFLQL